MRSLDRKGERPHRVVGEQGRRVLVGVVHLLLNLPLCGVVRTLDTEH